MRGGGFHKGEYFLRPGKISLGSGKADFSKRNPVSNGKNGFSRRKVDLRACEVESRSVEVNVYGVKGSFSVGEVYRCGVYINLSGGEVGVCGCEVDLCGVKVGVCGAGEGCRGVKVDVCSVKVDVCGVKLRAYSLKPHVRGVKVCCRRGGEGWVGVGGEGAGKYVDRVRGGVVGCATLSRVWT